MEKFKGLVILERFAEKMENVSNLNVTAKLIVNTNAHTLELPKLCVLNVFRMVIVQIMAFVQITAVQSLFVLAQRDAWTLNPYVLSQEPQQLIVKPVQQMEILEMELFKEIVICLIIFVTTTDPVQNRKSSQQTQSILAFQFTVNVITKEKPLKSVEKPLSISNTILNPFRSLMDSALLFST